MHKSGFVVNLTLPFSDLASINGSAANLGFEAKLRLAADKLRNNMDSAEYKHVVLGLIFLKPSKRCGLSWWPTKGDYDGSDPEDAHMAAPRSFLLKNCAKSEHREGQNR